GAEKPRVIGFGKRRLKAWHGLTEELAANVVVGDGRVRRIAADREALDERVRVIAQDVAVMTGPGLTLVGIADQVLLQRRVARHETPFGAGGKSRAAAAAQARSLHGVDDLLARRFVTHDFLPHRIAIDLAIVFQLPRLGVLECLKHHEVHLVAPVAHSSSSRMRSSFSGVRCSWNTWSTISIG